MAQFYAQIQGNRGAASRMGSKDSGIWSHTRGWNSGVEVVGRVDEDGNDVFEVFATSGSNGGGSRRLIATVNTVGGKMMVGT